MATRIPKEARERRPIPGLEHYEITSDGKNIWAVEEEEWVDNGYGQTPFPFPQLLDDEGFLVEVDRNAVTALAWLTPEQRQQVRDRFPGGIGEPPPPAAQDLAGQLGVTTWVLRTVARSSDEVLVEHHERRLAAAKAGREAAERIQDAQVEDYTATLYEYSRPPSRGGNTRALHVHAMTIAGERYTFFARGSKKWVFKNDRASFLYVLREGKYRNVLKNTLKVVDKDGQEVIRGHRDFKKTLRTAPTRLPGSRREWRD